MQPDALNLAIAQSIEKKPDYRPVITGSISGIQVFTDRASVTAAWEYKFHITRMVSQMSAEALEAGAIEEEIGDWQPRDFINEPSLSFLLLKRLAEEGDEPMLDYEGEWMVCGKANDWTSTPGYRNFSCARYPEPGPAIAEYYARAKGIYVDDKEQHESA